MDSFRELSLEYCGPKCNGTLGDHEIMMTFAGLQTSLERVDEALNALAK